MSNKNRGSSIIGNKRILNRDISKKGGLIRDMRTVNTIIMKEEILGKDHNHKLIELKNNTISRRINLVVINK